MADNIVISAIARVVDQASAPLKAIQGVIAGVADTAAKTGGAIADVGEGITKAVGGITGKLGAAAGKVGGFVRSMATMFGPISGLLGLGGIAGLSSTLTDFIAKTKELNSVAQRLGTTTDAVQTFYEALGGPERATEAMTKLQKTLVDVGKGGKEIQPTIALLRKMGVTMAEIKAGDLAAILPKIMEGFAKNENPILRAQAAIALFGKSGQDLIPYLIKGAAGFRAAAEDVRVFGINMQGVAHGLEAAKALKELGDVVESTRNKIAASIIVAFTPMVNWLTEFIKANRELLGQVALPAFIGSIATALVGLGVALLGVLGPWSLLVGAIVAAGVAIYQNWGDIVAWFDKEIPGLTDAIASAGRGIWEFVQKANADITAGFTSGGMAGGLNAIWATWKTGASDALAWVVGLLQNVDWGAVGTSAGQMLWQALLAVIRAEAALGQIIIDQFNAALAWMKSADWQSIGAAAGTLFVQAWIAMFKAAWDINVWAAGLVQQLGSALASTDWGAVSTAILRFFLDLNMTFLKIGKDLIVGLISGMVSAIPGLQAVADKISGMFSGALGWLKGVGTSIANTASSVANAAGESLARGTPGYGTPGLLAQPGAAAAPARSEVTTNINVNTPPGSTVTTSQTATGAPVGGGVNVGQSTMATGVP
jgi:hypothetical protein